MDDAKWGNVLWDFKKSHHQRRGRKPARGKTDGRRIRNSLLMSLCDALCSLQNGANLGAGAACYLLSPIDCMQVLN